ncbi:MAG: proton-conducting transporter membrane subunit [Lachnospiraceae bacterium]|nr:proton-conducting transporter membrane subunit [Lachnospiraceae bacterium]
MEQSFVLLVPILLPVLAGVILLCGRSFLERVQEWYTAAVLLVNGIIVVALCYFGGTGDGLKLKLFELVPGISIVFHLDSLGMFFGVFASLIWLVVGFYSFAYMKNEEHQTRFYGFYLIVIGVLVGIYQSGSLITMYVFYELMTITSLPLVLHEQNHEAIIAGLKYLFYSFFGAFLALAGILVLNAYGMDFTFIPGGSGAEILAGNKTMFLVVLGMMLVGFGVKAGLFPFQGWLPTAHPVAPAPASGVLSGVIAKSGVFAIIRVIYYLFGADFMVGSWVQKVFLTLTLITVLMGSVLAFWEKNFKKRLAYSTVSQVSYILFGIGLLNPTALTGSLLHVLCHGLIKNGLFLTAGICLVVYGYRSVDELSGIGKKMPWAIGGYTVLSLGLTGIPPFGGFLSKWYLAEGALGSGLSIFRWLGPVVLLISAVLTAGYLIPITAKGFFAGETGAGKKGREADYKREISPLLAVPILIFAVLIVFIGLFPDSLVEFFYTMASGLM